MTFLVATSKGEGVLGGQGRGGERVTREGRGGGRRERREEKEREEEEGSRRRKEERGEG